MNAIIIELILILLKGELTLINTQKPTVIKSQVHTNNPAPTVKTEMKI